MFKTTVNHQETDEPLLGASDHQVNVAPEYHALGDISGANLYESVEEFAQDYGLTPKLSLLYKSALLIQGITPLDQIPELTENESQALQDEVERKWSQPKMLYFTFLVCSLGAIVQGWSQTGVNGANLFFPTAFGIGSDSPRDTLLVGLINSAPYMSVGLIGAWTSDPVNQRLGRRGAISLGSAVALISTIGSAIAQNWQQLLAFRIVLGLGLGINASTVSVFAAECAPASIRGGLAVSWQMFTAFGIFLGFAANAVLYKFHNGWRLQLLAAFVPTIPLLLLVYFCPESPAWYIKSGRRYDLAFRSLCRLRNSELVGAKELYYSYLQQNSKTKNSTKKTSFFGKVIELFTIPRNRRATVASYVVMLSQQLCGINIIAFYSSTIFSDAGFSQSGALIASCVFGFINFLGAFPAVWTMDTLGRRTLLLLTLPPMALTMFFAGLSFHIPEESSAHFIVLATLIYLFCALYSPGMGPVPTIYSAESFPLSHREVGMSLAVSAANSWATIVALTFPALLTFLNPPGAFELYAALNLFAFVLVFLFVPETKKKTLEELDSVFSGSVTAFAKERVQGIWSLGWRGKAGNTSRSSVQVGRTRYSEVAADEEDENGGS